MDKKAQNEKEPLTLDGLARYSREVLLPAIDERFERIDQRFEKVATKEDVAGVKTELKQEIAHVRGAVLTAETITVAFELSRRLSPVRNGHKPQITGPKEIYLLLNAEMSHLKQEVYEGTCTGYQEPSRAHTDRVCRNA